jgi:predicted PurR-regulated permease PerM
MKYRFPRAIAVISLFLGFFILFAGFFYFFLPPLLDDLSGFASSLPRYIESFSVGGSGSLSNIFGPQGFIGSFSGSTLSLQEIVSQMRDAFFGFSSGIFNGVNVIFGGLLSFALIVVLSFYLSVQEKGIENFLRTVTSIKNEDYVLDLWARTRHKIGLWMQGQLVLGLLMGVFVYLGLSIMGLPYAFLLAVIAAVFELIPLFGPILAAVPAVAIAFTSAGPGLGLTVIGFYVIMQQFENHLIYPLVVRKVIGVPPLVVILALLIFGKLFGFLGIIIAVPAVTMLLEVADDMEKRKGAKRVKAA